MKIKPNTSRLGFSLLEIMAIIAVVGILAWLLLPRGRGNKSSPYRIQCVNNLKQIGIAFHQWANDHAGQLPMDVSLTNGGVMELVVTGNMAMVFQIMSNELYTPKILLCPADKRRVIAKSFDQGIGNSNVNYFVGLDTKQTLPQMFLSGDDNLMTGREARGSFVVDAMRVKPGLLLIGSNAPATWTEDRHKRQGNVGLADGSVQYFSTARLMESLRNTGVATNRLVFP